MYLMKSVIVQWGLVETDVYRQIHWVQTVHCTLNFQKCDEIFVIMACLCTFFNSCGQCVYTCT